MQLMQKLLTCFLCKSQQRNYDYGVLIYNKEESNILKLFIIANRGAAGFEVVSLAALN